MYGQNDIHQFIVSMRNIYLLVIPIQPIDTSVESQVTLSGFNPMMLQYLALEAIFNSAWWDT